MSEREVVNAINKLSRGHNDLSKAFQAFAVKAANEEARKNIELNKELYRTYSSTTSSYTNLIIVAGFAGFLSLLNALSVSMKPLNLYVCGLFITLSLAFFISFEIYKMIVISSHVNRVFALMGSQKISAVDAFDNIKAEIEGFNMVNGRVWRVALIATILTGTIATAFLIYSLIVHIMTALPLQ
ncbi:hypothetical protein [Aeromonas media]|uniref:hypothetical protein n=1 Tax=Aeromonas media TaxID=651 RepID=UPI003CFD6BAA